MPPGRGWTGRARPGRDAALALMEIFWPGSLSVIVPARPGLPGQLQDASGGISLRLTPHPQARELCLRVGSPLAATSANVSGDPAVSTLSGLSAAVCLGADYVLAGDPGPGGGRASTVVKPVAGRRVILFREGAVTVEQIVSAGFAGSPHRWRAAPFSAMCSKTETRSLASPYMGSRRWLFYPAC